jgi:hypothetical protein
MEWGNGTEARAPGDVETRPEAYGLGSPAPVPSDLQTRLNRAYLSGNGAEVERLLAQIAEANFALPPKSRAA